MKHPTPYDGKPDIQKFDQWIASILNYADVMKIRERTMIVRTCVLTPFPPTPVKSRSLCFPLILAFPSQYVPAISVRLPSCIPYWPRPDSRST